MSYKLSRIPLAFVPNTTIQGNHESSIPSLPLTALVAASVSACGGGSDSASTGSTSGVVTGSYFEHAKVCIDANNNGKCDAGEASTYTDAKGNYSLTGQGNVIVEVGTDAFRNDPDTGAHNAITEPLVFRAPAKLRRHRQCHLDRAGHPDGRQRR